MNRREFVQYAALTTAWAGSSLSASNRAVPEIAFTFDDPTIEGGAGLSWREVNEKILGALAGHRVKAVLFVTGKRVDSDGGRELIAAWDCAGHLIGSHSYSHMFFNVSDQQPEDGLPKVTLSDFEVDALRNESLIRAYTHFTRLFFAIPTSRKATR